MKRKRYIGISLGLIVITFLLLYSATLINLPLFGDATTHGKISNALMNNKTINSPYPLGYNIFQVNCVIFLGEIGYKIPILIGLLLIGIFTFLLMKEMTKNSIISLFITILAFASPKLIYYSTRMYMEILISAVFLICLYYLFLFNKKLNKNYLVLVCIFNILLLSIKQTGILFLIPLIIFLFLLLINKKINLTFFFICSLIFLLSLPAYIELFNRNGEIYPGSSEFAFFQGINKVIAKVSTFHLTNELFFNKWNTTLTDIEKEYYPLGAKFGEAKHIWPQDIFSYSNFFKINSLYVLNFMNTNYPNWIILIIQILIVFGLFIFIKDSIINKEKKLFLYFILILLIINYTTFIRNTDQMRYFLYIPLIFLIFIVFAISHIKEKIILTELTKIFFIFAIVILLLNFSYQDLKLNKKWERSQIYSPSLGGIRSIIESANWFNENTPKNTKFFQNCGNEFSFYADRENIGDWRYLFLSEQAFKQILKEQNIEYVVIFKSQIVKDLEWHNFCWVPNSFKEKVQNISTQVYKSSMGDIIIYKLK